MTQFSKKDTGAHRPLSNHQISGEELANRQLKKFGISMSVMAASIGLYYLGFFGSFDGPLHPTRVGEKLSRLGFTAIHLLVIFIILFAASVTWNWIYNLFNRWTGRRHCCLRKNDSGEICGAATAMQKIQAQPAGANNRLFLCEKGHKNTHARYIPVKKDKWGYSLCAVMLVLVCGTALYIF